MDTLEDERWRDVENCCKSNSSQPALRDELKVMSVFVDVESTRIEITRAVVYKRHSFGRDEGTRILNEKGQNWGATVCATLLLFFELRSYKSSETTLDRW